MVKRAKLATKKARKLLEGEKDAAPAAALPEGPRPAPHIQRKLTRKVKFLERVAASKLSASKGGVTKKKKKKPSVALTDLASLAASLAEVAKADETSGGRRREFGRSVGTQKARAQVAVVETQRLQQVLQHPQFQANPIAAITSHLSAMLPTAPPPLPSIQQLEDLAQRRREKKKRRKERGRGVGVHMGDD